MSGPSRMNPELPGASPPSGEVDRIGAIDRALETDLLTFEVGSPGGDDHPARRERVAVLADSGRGDAESHNRRGVGLYARGDRAGAIAEFDRAIALDPRHVVSHANRGVARHGLGDLDAALADLGRALELDPRHAEAAYNRGLVRHVREDVEGAIADFDRALQLDPRHVQAYIARGGSRYHAGDPEAHADYWIALRIHPRLAATKIVRKLANDLRSDPVAVLANCARHLRAAADDVVAHARRGLTLLLLGRDGEAAEDLIEALRRAPEWEGPLGLLIAEARQQPTPIADPGRLARLADWHPSRPRARACAAPSE